MSEHEEAYLYIGLLCVNQLLDDLAQSLGDGHVPGAGPLGLGAGLCGVGVPLAIHHCPTTLWEGLVQRALNLHILREQNRETRCSF